MRKRKYNEKEDEWRLRMQDLEAISFCLILITIILSYYVMDYNLINTPLCEVSIFFCVVSALSFLYTLYIGTEGTMKGYHREDEDNA